MLRVPNTENNLASIKRICVSGKGRIIPLHLQLPTSDYQVTSTPNDSLWNGAQVLELKVTGTHNTSIRSIATLICFISFPLTGRNPKNKALKICFLSFDATIATTIAHYLALTAGVQPAELILLFYFTLLNTRSFSIKNASEEPIEIEVKRVKSKDGGMIISLSRSKLEPGSSTDVRCFKHY